MDELLRLLEDREAKHSAFRAAESRLDALVRPSPGQRAHAEDELNNAHWVCQQAYGALQDWFAHPDNIETLLAYVRAHPTPAPTEQK